ncbi:MAG: hypothetical protein JXA13_02630 [Anaerolineales bacterium]|nr:hypothetical protein [Anaerolineales bacterium]
MKKFRPKFLLTIGSLLSFTSAAFSYSAPVGQPALLSSQTSKTSFSTAAQKVSESGSTDGIVFMAIIIVLIVIIPIIWTRSQWFHD